MSNLYYTVHKGTKVRRFKERKEFTRLSKMGNEHVSPAFVLLYEKNDSGEVGIGYTTSKKIGNAVQRNRGRRRLKAVFDKVIRLNEEFSTDGLNISVIVRKAALNRDYDRMVSELTTILKQMGCKV